MFITSLEQMKEMQGNTFKFTSRTKNAVAYAKLGKVEDNIAELKYTYCSQFDAKNKDVYLKLDKSAFNDEDITIESL